MDQQQNILTEEMIRARIESGCKYQSLTGLHEDLKEKEGIQSTTYFMFYTFLRKHPQLKERLYSSGTVSDLRRKKRTLKTKDGNETEGIDEVVAEKVQLGEIEGVLNVLDALVRKYPHHQRGRYTGDNYLGKHYTGLELLLAINKGIEEKELWVDNKGKKYESIGAARDGTSTLHEWGLVQKKDGRYVLTEKGEACLRYVHEVQKLHLRDRYQQLMREAEEIQRKLEIES